VVGLIVHGHAHGEGVEKLVSVVGSPDTRTSSGQPSSQEPDMTIKSLNPYLTFNGDAEQAIKFYEQALGARVVQIIRFDQVPGMNPAEEHKQRVMHCQLDIAGATLMVSDTMPRDPAPGVSSIHVVLHLSDEADQQTKFDALAAGGRVSFALHDTFWGAKFGMLVDKFGVPWMLNCERR
jgi:PhnB protein